MADNFRLDITPPSSLVLATDEISHGGDTSQAQVATLYEVTGAEGAKTATPVVYSTQLGATSEAAAATDTSTSGLNGMLKRIAQRITSFIALFPAALGANGGLKVDIVGDTGTVTVLDSDNIAAVSLNTKSMVNGSTTLVPKFAKIAAASSGNNAIVAAVTAKKIRVLAMKAISNGTVNAKFQSDGAGTPVDLTGLSYYVANAGEVLPFNPLGWFESASGKSLDLNLSAAIAVGGALVYVEV